MKLRKSTASIALALAGLIGVTACSSVPEPALTKPVVKEVVTTKVGKAIEVPTADGGKAKITVKSPKYTKELKDTLLAMPSMHDGYLTVDIKWETTEGVTEPEEASFIAHSEKGFMAMPEMTIKNRVEPGPLKKGGKTSESVSFDLPKGPATIEISSPSLEKKIEVAVP